MRWMVLAVSLVGACGTSKHGTDPTTCHGLGIAECRDTAGCVPDICPGCGCGETYRGCLESSEQPDPCPLLGCPSAECCTETMACTSGICVTPGTSLGCGACNDQPSDCTDDASCAAGSICDPIACSCGGNRACVPGCTADAECGEGFVCETASPHPRCVPQACPCPDNFDCTANACARRACTDDATCEGYCVNGSCYAERGECQFPPP